MTESSSLQLTVLIDNTVYMPSLRAEHGLSILAEADGTQVLLDTGQTAQVIQNARLLGVELADVAHVALSHGHMDHTGGLECVLAKTRKAALYAHPAAFEEKFKKLHDASYRYIGCPLQLDDVKARCDEVKFSTEPQQLPAAFGLTGEVPRVHEWEKSDNGFATGSGQTKSVDKLLDDQSLFWDGPGGPVVVAGCAHSGIINTLERVAELTGKKQIHAVLGGFHLKAASDERIDLTIDALKRFGVERLGLGHCTGFKAMQRMAQALGDKCFECPVGTRVSFGA